tara:strand:+ start:162 stop:368 length:207 start_codon:yes stop_codon:yes gene_type:complete
MKNTDSILKQRGWTIQEKTGLLVYNIGRYLIEIKLTDFNNSLEELGTEGTIDRLAQIVNSAPLRRVHT